MDGTPLWQTKARHHIPWTATEAREAVAAWQTSGLSLRDFARSHGIAWQRLAQAKSRVLKIEQPCGPAIFLPVTIGETAMPSVPATLHLGALTIEVASLEVVSPAWLAQLIAACESSR
jgi:hypothetical protein